MPRSKPPLYCSFCGKSDREVTHLVAGPTVFICGECVDLAKDIIDAGMAYQGTTFTAEQHRVAVADLRKQRQE